MLKVAVLASGGGTNLQAVIDKIDSGYLNCKIVKVIASKSDAYVLKRAAKYNIDCEVIAPLSFKDIHSFTKAMIDLVVQSGAELVVLAGYLTILNEEFVRAFRNRIINIHPSLIPSFCGKGYYGLKVHEEVLNSGVKITGATVHFVDENADTGPIILQKAVPVLDEDNVNTIQKRVMEEAERVILPEAIRLFSESKLTIEGKRVKIREDLQ